MRYKRILSKWLINHFFSCTRFFKIKRIILLWCGIKVGVDTKIVGPIYFGNVSTIEIGKNCWIGENIHLDGNGSIKIGDNIDIAPHVIISTGGHLIGNNMRRAGENKVNSVIIKNGCWIGTRTTIINSIVINEGVLVAAGSVVNKDVAANILVAGVPAREKRRFSNDKYINPCL